MDLFTILGAIVDCKGYHWEYRVSGEYFSVSLCAKKKIKKAAESLLDDNDFVGLENYGNINVVFDVEDNLIDSIEFESDTENTETHKIKESVKEYTEKYGKETAYKAMCDCVATMMKRA